MSYVVRFVHSEPRVPGPRLDRWEFETLDAAKRWANEHPPPEDGTRQQIEDTKTSDHWTRLDQHAWWKSTHA